ncbi:MAG: alcohol dehydrogenase [Alphaproteobacteria bacterium]|nr:alcohol dehydrogenase [Alphaproteobacteria bacterium]HCP00033.1 NADPH:quinone reductase [Rhodospirillaceae bacterium]
MKTVWYEKLGPAREVLSFGEMETSEPGPGEVRVKLHASGVNPADVKRRGLGTYGMEHPRIIPNSDGAGTIDALGEDVSHLGMGERVWLFNGQRQGRAYGTAAEYITLDAGLVAPLPDDLDFDAGACLGIPCMTAHRNVFADGPVNGRTILVTGGAGAVGHYAVQWAKWGGANVLATVSSNEKAAHARAAGANHTVNYNDVDAAKQILDLTNGIGVDRIVEVDLAANLELSSQVIRSGGIVSVYASMGDPQGIFMRMAPKNALLRFMVLHSVPREATDAARSDIKTWLAAGHGTHNIAGTFPLNQCVEAHEFVESGNKLGTVIVRPTE